MAGLCAARRFVERAPTDRVGRTDAQKKLERIVPMLLFVRVFVTQYGLHRFAAEILPHLRSHLWLHLFLLDYQLLPVGDSCLQTVQFQAVWVDFEVIFFHVNLCWSQRFTSINDAHECTKLDGDLVPHGLLPRWEVGVLTMSKHDELRGLRGLPGRLPVRSLGERFLVVLRHSSFN